MSLSSESVASLIPTMRSFSPRRRSVSTDKFTPVLAGTLYNKIGVLVDKTVDTVEHAAGDFADDVKAAVADKGGITVIFDAFDQLLSSSAQNRFEPSGVGSTENDDILGIAAVGVANRGLGAGEQLDVVLKFARRFPDHAVSVFFDGDVADSFAFGGDLERIVFGSVEQNCAENQQQQR